MKSNLNEALAEFGLKNIEVEKILNLALRKGGDLAELFFEETSSSRLFYEGGRVDRILTGIDRGVGLRILDQGRSVYGYTTDFEQSSMENLAQSLSEALERPQGSKKSTSAYNWRHTPQPVKEISSYQIQRKPGDLPMASKIEILKKTDEVARAEFAGVRQVSSVFLDSERKILTLNSDGQFAADTKTYLQIMVQVVGEKQGRIETAYESDGGYVGLEFFDEVHPEEIARTAARRVVTLLDAQAAPAGTMTVVLSSQAGGTMIHEAVGHGLEADLACNGLSVYQGKLGQAVASPLITVVDDGTLSGKRGSYCYDDEGTASQKTVLIENGILKTYLVDRLSAMKFDLMATGNGRRESFRHKPIVRMTNTYIAPGQDDPAEILKSTPQGVFVQAMGGGQVDTVTGDFVFAVTEGYLIRDGKLAEPIRGATLVGNGPAVLIHAGQDQGLCKTAQWAECQRAIDHCRDAPSLQLNA
ncbi:MAG: TldD/PmbA family protein [Bdellovibrionia bacterium]